MRLALQTVDDAVRKLGELLNINIRHIGDAFTMVDGHQFVMRRILHDIWRGQVMPTPLTATDKEMLAAGNFSYRPPIVPESSIDYEWYYMQYNCCLAVSAFISALHPVKHKEPEMVVDQQENDFVFGGDYEGSNSSPG